MSEQLLSPEATFVEIGASVGEWFVRVTDQGVVTLYSFEGRRIAIDFAEDTRKRLKLGSFVQEGGDDF